MYERAVFFRNKFNRNGIAGFIISLILFKREFDISSYNVFFILLPLISIIWLYAGWWINKNLKLKSETEDLNQKNTEFISYKIVQNIYFILLFIVILIGIKKWEYAAYVAIPVISLYMYWLYTQIKLLKIYFNN